MVKQLLDNPEANELEFQIHNGNEHKHHPKITTFNL